MSAQSGNGIRGAALVAALALLAGCSLGGARATRTSDAALVAAGQQAGQPAAADGVQAPVREVPAAEAAIWARARAAMLDEDWLAAEAALGQLTRDYPQYAGPFVNLAIVYRRSGREQEAEAALGRALAIDANHAAANNELGMLLRGRGEFAAAEAAYRRALVGDPEYAYAHYNLGVLLDLYLQRRAEAVEHYEAYQRLVEEPDTQVGFWIADLRRRLGLPPATIQVAQEEAR